MKRAKKAPIVPLTAADYICVMCEGPIRSDRDAPPETTWFDTNHDGRPYHAACLDKASAQSDAVQVPSEPEEKDDTQQEAQRGPAIDAPVGMTQATEDDRDHD